MEYAKRGFSSVVKEAARRIQHQTCYITEHVKTIALETTSHVMAGVPMIDSSVATIAGVVAVIIRACGGLVTQTVKQLQHLAVENVPLSWKYLPSK